jgi:Protein of unknown function, DUF488
MDAWCKNLAPSGDLRRWFSHDPVKWKEFQRRYRAVLSGNPAAFQPLFDAARLGNITLLYSARDTEHNSALVRRLANNGDVAGGQLAVFQGASEAPISDSYGSSEQRGKTANWPRPGGLR